MPGRNGTGPNGLGPRTGRGFGPCGCGCKRGFGRGFGRRAWTTPQEMVEANREPTEKELLSELKAERKEIDKTIKELEQKKK
jgi:hypothetical protein